MHEERSDLRCVSLWVKTVVIASIELVATVQRAAVGPAAACDHSWRGGDGLGDEVGAVEDELGVDAV